MNPQGAAASLDSSPECVVLQAHNCAWRFGLYNPRTGSFLKCPIWWRCRNRSLPVAGWYGRMGRTIGVLYRGIDGLHVGFGRTDLLVSSRLQIDLDHDGETSSLSIRLNQAVIGTIRYRTPRRRSAASTDLTPFVEDEQYDFGLFIRNVVASPDRQRAMLAAGDDSTPG
jgi:hypothetical protein